MTDQARFPNVIKAQTNILNQNELKKFKDNSQNSRIPKKKSMLNKFANEKKHPANDSAAAPATIKLPPNRNNNICGIIQSDTTKTRFVFNKKAKTIVKKPVSQQKQIENGDEMSPVSLLKKPILKNMVKSNDRRDVSNVSVKNKMKSIRNKQRSEVSKSENTKTRFVSNQKGETDIKKPVSQSKPTENVDEKSPVKISLLKKPVLKNMTKSNDRQDVSNVSVKNKIKPIRNKQRSEVSKSKNTKTRFVSNNKGETDVKKPVYLSKPTDNGDQKSPVKISLLRKPILKKITKSNNRPDSDPTDVVLVKRKIVPIRNKQLSKVSKSDNTKTRFVSNKKGETDVKKPGSLSKPTDNGDQKSPAKISLLQKPILKNMPNIKERQGYVTAACPFTIKKPPLRNNGAGELARNRFKYASAQKRLKNNGLSGLSDGRLGADKQEDLRSEHDLLNPVGNGEQRREPLMNFDDNSKLTEQARDESVSNVLQSKKPAIRNRGLRVKSTANKTAAEEPQVDKTGIDGPRNNSTVAGMASDYETSSPPARSDTKDINRFQKKVSNEFSTEVRDDGSCKRRKANKEDINNAADGTKPMKNISMSGGIGGSGTVASSCDIPRIPVVAGIEKTCFYKKTSYGYRPGVKTKEDTRKAADGTKLLKKVPVSGVTCFGTMATRCTPQTSSYRFWHEVERKIYQIQRKGNQIELSNIAFLEYCEEKEKKAEN